MAKVVDGRTFDESWNEIDAMGNKIGGGKDYAANAAWAGQTGGQNPYSNKPGASSWDTSGLIPENEPGSTMAKGTATGGGTTTGGTTGGGGNDWAGWSTGGTSSSGGTTGGWGGPVSGGTPGYGVAGYQGGMQQMTTPRPSPNGGLVALPSWMQNQSMAQQGMSMPQGQAGASLPQGTAGAQLPQGQGGGGMTDAAAQAWQANRQQQIQQQQAAAAAGGRGVSASVPESLYANTSTYQIPQQGGGLVAEGGNAGTFVPPPPGVGQPQTGGPTPIEGFGTPGSAPGQGQGYFPSVTASQLDAPALLAQLGQTPNVAAAGPLSGFGSDVQGSIRNDITRGDAVDTNDPTYRAQVDAFRMNQQRTADKTRAAMAARANATGTLGSGGFDSQVMRGLQNQGEQNANFEAQLMGSELANNRARTARAQQMGAGLLSQEQSQGLQERLANQSGALQGMGWNNQRDLSNQGAQMQTGLANQAALDRAALANQQAALTSRGMGYQEQRGINDDLLRRNALGLQGELGRGDLDLRRLGLTNQDSQFYAGLGQQLGLANRGFDQNAMLALLGG